MLLLDHTLVWHISGAESVPRCLSVWINPVSMNYRNRTFFHLKEAWRDARAWFNHFARFKLKHKEKHSLWNTETMHYSTQQIVDCFVLVFQKFLVRISSRALFWGHIFFLRRTSGIYCSSIPGVWWFNQWELFKLNRKEKPQFWIAENQHCFCQHIVNGLVPENFLVRTPLRVFWRRSFFVSLKSQRVLVFSLNSWVVMNNTSSLTRSNKWLLLLHIMHISKSCHLFTA